MKSRSIILYWLLLLVPTLGAGFFMLHLLRNEGERLAMTESAALQNKARLLADEVAAVVDEAKDGLMNSLRNLAFKDLAGELQTWERANPLVRNVFIWDAGERRLMLPDASNGITGEQSAFTRRYADLFTGRAPWPVTPLNDAPLQQQLAYSTRQQIRAMSKSDYNVKPNALQQQAAVEPEQSGWVVWHWEDGLHLLGWLRDGGTIRGVEIEMSALLSRIAAGFNERPAAGLTFAILDGNGQIFAQHGTTEATAAMKPLVSATLAPQLPHWQVAIYGSPAAATRRSFALVSTLLVGVFIIAILSGGSLLLWQARRNMLEAQQRTSFVANVSHELKTPLTTIRMYSEMMTEGRVASDEKRRTYLETITRETQRLTRLINNVLDFSRIEQGKKKYQTERLDIAVAAREVLDAQADRLREAGLELTTEFPDAPAFAKLDRDAFSQCLLNLVDNAIKYAGGGKLTVRLWSDDGPSSHDGQRPSLHAWQLIVEDSGPGIPSAHCAKLFQQFHRADDSLTTKVAGFGLGLSISRRLLRDQGGDLLYERAASGGARFTMVLPGDAT